METLSLEFISERELYLCYMPFFKNGGLFIRTTDAYPIGAEIALEVMLPDALEPAKVKGKVSWRTPPGAQSGTPVGVGVAFEADDENLRAQIEKNISRLLSSAEPTLSM